MTQSCSRRPSSPPALEFRLLCHMHTGLERRASHAHGASSKHPRAQARPLGQLAPVPGATNQRNGSDATPAQPCSRARAAGPVDGAELKARPPLAERRLCRNGLLCAIASAHVYCTRPSLLRCREGRGVGACLRRALARFFVGANAPTVCYCNASARGGSGHVQGRSPSVSCETSLRCGT